MIHKNIHIIHITHVLTHIIYITHITYMTHNIHITHIVKLTFKTYKKTDTIFFYNCFLYIKMLTRYYQKYKERLSKKVRERYQNVSE